MGRPSNTGERRAQIVKGLYEVMAERGYDGASVAEVARAADLTPGLVHYHFTSKREILIALVDWLADRAATRAAGRLGRARSPMARLEGLIDAYLAPGRQADPRAVACWVGITAEAIRDPAVREAVSSALQKTLDALESAVSAVLKLGPQARRDARAIAAAILAAIQGYFVLAMTSPGAVPPGSAAGSVRRMARGLIEGRGK